MQINYIILVEHLRAKWWTCNFYLPAGRLEVDGAPPVGHGAFHPHEEIPLGAQLFAFFAEAAAWNTFKHKQHRQYAFVFFPRKRWAPPGGFTDDAEERKGKCTSFTCFFLNFPFYSPLISEFINTLPVRFQPEFRISTLHKASFAYI